MQKQSTINNRTKKAERRENKAARKEANKTEDRKNSPNNLFLGILIFGVIVGMLAVGWGIKYFQKEATIASYLKANKDTYTNMQFDAYSTADVTAKKNKMTITIKAETDDKEVIKEMKEYYAGEDAQKTLKEIGAYYLVTIKPQTRAIYADARVSVTLNGEELAKTDLTTFDADRIMNGTYYNDIEGKDKEKTEEKTEEDTGEAMEVEVNEDGTVVIPDEGEESNGNE